VIWDAVLALAMIEGSGLLAGDAVSSSSSGPREIPARIDAGHVQAFASIASRNANMVLLRMLTG
jgi:hypothetical protein